MAQRASVGDKITAINAGWSFSGSVAEAFDDHVSKSVPLYREGHKMICGLSDFFVKPGSRVYEIGSSTGTLTFELASHNAGKAGTSFIGLDVEADMVAKAQDKAQDKTLNGRFENVSFVAEDALTFELEPSDLIVAYYTVQFVKPSVRQILIDKIYKSLNWGGAFILFEKVRGPDARFQDISTSLYNDYKLEQGYNAEEIISKSRSLKGVLEPFSTQGNIDLLKRAGFTDVMTVQKYICFEGMLAIK
jgi:tRNA (cmo5U34)-methyltransferase